MSAEKLLRDLQEREVAVTVRGERLRVEAPRGALTEELRSMLSEHKPEIVQFLYGQSRDEATPPALLDVDVEKIAAMRISEFARAGLMLQVYSAELRCDVLFVSDNVAEDEIPDLGLTVYRASELRKIALWRPKPQDLQRVHLVKEIFQGAYGATIAEIKQASASGGS